MQTGFPVPAFSPTYAESCFCDSGKTFADCCGSNALNRQPPAGVLIYPGIVPRDECRQWVERLEEQPREPAEVTTVKKTAAVGHRTAGRVCDDVQPGVLHQRINQQVEQGFGKAAAAIGERLAWFETPRILRYEAGGFYHRHADSCQVVQPGNTWYKVRDRDLSLLLYLNEDYRGGGLSFINFNYHYRPSTGDLLVFPSDNRYEHRAEKVTSGLRYAIASWGALAGSRRVFPEPPPGAIHASP